MAKRESQTIEYKSSWQEEFFKWICGYANAKGGKMYIGVNDDGYVVGLENVKYLLDTLPNQVNSFLGIGADIEQESVGNRGENIKFSNNAVPMDIAQKPVNLYARGILTEQALHDIDADPNNTTSVSEEVRALFDAAPGYVKQLRQSEDRRKAAIEELAIWEKENPISVESDGSLEYVCITVKPYPYGISYHNHYYIRSGGTTRELTGVELTNFLMERVGKHWDGMPIPGVTVSDLDAYAIQVYRAKAVKSGRRSQADVDSSDEQTVSDLKLIDESMESKGDLTRAAVMMFHPDPERFVAGASVKIAYYALEGAYGANKSDDIIYHNEIHGPLILQADKVVDMVYTKYLKALVSYDGLQRIETFMTPREAFREVILNAINHKVYESGNPIQISVYEDKIIVFNQGYWPEDIELDEIYSRKHSSYPHNPNLSRVFFNSGEIEAYGTGFSKIRIECDEHNAPYPEVEITPNGVTVEIKACDLYMKLLKHGRYWETYPDNKIKNTDFLTTDDGEVITADDGVPLVVEEIKDADPDVLKSIDRMMEILSKNLTEAEKKIYLPIAEYLKTHEVIKNVDVMQMTGKGSSSANRYLARLVDLEVLDAEGEKKGRIYRRRRA